MNEFTEYNNLLKFIAESKLTRINIIGSPASGKTTLTKQLGDDLELPIYDLDDFLYHNGCKRKNLDEDKIAISEILKNEKYIIDGTYSSSLSFRVNDVEMFIMIKGNKWQYLFRFLKRVILTSKLKCGERITLKTLSLIINYDKILNRKIIPSIPINKIVYFFN